LLGVILTLTGAYNTRGLPYHTTEQKMISNALASYYIKDGMLILKCGNVIDGESLLSFT